MKPEEWTQLEAVYAAGMDLPAQQRHAFWQTKFLDNPLLRAELDLLICGEQNAAAAGFLDKAAWALESEHGSRTERENVNMIGKVISNYEIISSIGKGGMGQVYLAKDKKLGREVALKMVPDALNADAVARFQDERLILCKIEHDNVARLYDGGMDEEHRPFLVMEYLRGFISLREFVRQAKGLGLPLNQVKAITRQFCTGLAQAHDKGIVHRDVKPENVMLVNDRDGLRVKVIDFGIAIAPAFTTEEFNKGVLTHRPSVFSPGTTVYKSPEQLENKPREEIKISSDVYSFALVIYEMLTGRMAFPSEVHRVHERDFPPASSLRPGLGNEIDAVIERALSNNPQHRPDIRALADAVIAALPQSANLASGIANPFEMEETAESPELETLIRKVVHLAAVEVEAQPAKQLPKERNRWLVRGTGLIVVLLAAVIGWGVWPNGPKTEPLPENHSSVPTPSPEPSATANTRISAGQQMKLALFRNNEASPAAPDAVWRNGNSVKFKLSFDQDGYLYVLNHGSDGSLNVLFPHHRVNNGDNHVLANRRLTIPPASSTPTGGFRLDAAPGTETFYIIVAPKNLNRDEMLLPIKTAIQRLGTEPRHATVDLIRSGDWFSQLRANSQIFDLQNSTANTDADGSLIFKGSGILVKAVRLKHIR